MSAFTPLEGTALLRSQGIYSERPLASLNGAVFAKQGQGYIRLLAHGQTTRASTTWLKIDAVDWVEKGGYVYLSASLPAVSPTRKKKAT